MNDDMHKNKNLKQNYAALEKEFADFRAAAEKKELESQKREAQLKKEFADFRAASKIREAKLSNQISSTQRNFDEMSIQYYRSR
jgi:septal ring factor EnvC (AmiA/AmiB activator)